MTNYRTLLATGAVLAASITSPAWATPASGSQRSSNGRASIPL